MKRFKRVCLSGIAAVALVATPLSLASAEEVDDTAVIATDQIESTEPASPAEEVDVEPASPADVDEVAQEPAPAEQPVSDPEPIFEPEPTEVSAPEPEVDAEPTPVVEEEPPSQPEPTGEVDEGEEGNDPVVDDNFVAPDWSVPPQSQCGESGFVPLNNTYEQTVVLQLRAVDQGGEGDLYVVDTIELEQYETSDFAITIPLLTRAGGQSPWYVDIYNVTMDITYNGAVYEACDEGPVFIDLVVPTAECVDGVPTVVLPESNEYVEYYMDEDQTIVRARMLQEGRQFNYIGGWFDDDDEEDAIFVIRDDFFDGLDCNQQPEEPEETVITPDDNWFIHIQNPGEGDDWIEVREDYVDQLVIVEVTHEDGKVIAGYMPGEGYVFPEGHEAVVDFDEFVEPGTDPELIPVDVSTIVDPLEGIPNCSDYIIPEIEGVQYEISDWFDLDTGILTILIRAVLEEGYVLVDQDNNVLDEQWVDFEPRDYDQSECGWVPPTEPPAEEQPISQPSERPVVIEVVVNQPTKSKPKPVTTQVVSQQSRDRLPETGVGVLAPLGLAFLLASGGVFAIRRRKR